MHIVSLGEIYMNYQSLFSGKNKKNISNCRLLKILPSMLCVKSGLNQNDIYKSSFFPVSLKNRNCIPILPILFEICDTGHV